MYYVGDTGLPARRKINPTIRNNEKQAKLSGHRCG